MDQPSILIVGGGIAGLTTAWHLAQAGHGREVILLEAEDQLGAHSTALNAAILRTLGPDKLFTQIGIDSARFLRDPPPGFSDVPLIDALGLILAASPERTGEIAGWVDDLEDPAAAVELMSSEELKRMVPAFEAPVGAAWSFPEEGRLDIAALVAGYVRGAKIGGVDFRRGSRVGHLLVEDRRVVGVRLEDGHPVRADITVLAAGGWVEALGRSAGSRVNFRPTLRHLAVTEPVADVERSWPVLWYFGPGDDGEFYCRPEAGGMLLSACEVLDTDPDRLRVDADCRAEIARKTSAHLPMLAEAGLAHFWCGMRTLTADGHFAIGPDPDRPGLFWVAGLGGSGMVASAEIGRIASSLLLGHSVPTDLEAALAPARLATGD